MTSSAKSRSSKRSGGLARSRQRSVSSRTAVTETLASRLREVRGVVSDALKTARQQTAQKAAEGARIVRLEVEDYADSKKGAAAAQVEGVGETVRQAARQLRLLRMDPVAEYLDRATNVIEESAGYLQERDITDIVDDLAGLVRRYPGFFLSTLLIAGFGATRFIKASVPDRVASNDVGIATNRRSRTRPRRAGKNGRAHIASSSD